MQTDLQADSWGALFRDAAITAVATLKGRKTLWPANGPAFRLT